MPHEWRLMIPPYSVHRTVHTPITRPWERGRRNPCSGFEAQSVAGLPYGTLHLYGLYWGVRRYIQYICTILAVGTFREDEVQ